MIAMSLGSEDQVSRLPNSYSLQNWETTETWFCDPFNFTTAGGKCLKWFPACTSKNDLKMVWPWKHQIFRAARDAAPIYLGRCS